MNSKFNKEHFLGGFSECLGWCEKAWWFQNLMVLQSCHQLRVVVKVDHTWTSTLRLCGRLCGWCVDCMQSLWIAEETLHSKFNFV